MKIFITRQIPEVGITKLKAAGHAVIVAGTEPLEHADLIARLKEESPDAVIALLTDKIDAAVFDATPNAKIFANYAVGFDNIDLKAAKDRGITITNTPEVLTEAVAEHTAALIMAAGRRLVEADAFLRAGEYRSWDPLLLLGMEFKGKTLGIVGCGRIGRRLAEIMHHGFGMDIAYFDRKPDSSLESALGARYAAEIDELLSTSDVVSVHLPLTDETRHLFNQERFSKMKPGSIFVNTARGAIVDEKALAAALRDGTLSVAALDVFENEPAVDSDLLALKNVVLTPHIASATREARDQMSLVAADNVIAVLDGRPALNPVS